MELRDIVFLLCMGWFLLVVIVSVGIEAAIFEKHGKEHWRYNFGNYYFIALLFPFSLVFVGYVYTVRFLARKLMKE